MDVTRHPYSHRNGRSPARARGTGTHYEAMAQRSTGPRLLRAARCRWPSRAPRALLFASTGLPAVKLRLWRVLPCFARSACFALAVANAAAERSAAARTKKRAAFACSQRDCNNASGGFGVMSRPYHRRHLCSPAPRVRTPKLPVASGPAALSPLPVLRLPPLPSLLHPRPVDVFAHLLHFGSSRSIADAAAQILALRRIQGR